MTKCFLRNKKLRIGWYPWDCVVGIKTIPQHCDVILGLGEGNLDLVFDMVIK